MFPIVRRVTINHFKRAEIQKEVEFDAKMQKFKVDQEVFNESFRLLTPQQQKEINDLRISRLKEKEETKQKKVEKESTELSRPKKEDGFSFF
jgi:Spy/CpxP family protein refolding chaperone